MAHEVVLLYKAYEVAPGAALEVVLQYEAYEVAPELFYSMKYMRWHLGWHISCSTV